VTMFPARGAVAAVVWAGVLFVGVGVGVATASAATSVEDGPIVGVTPPTAKLGDTVRVNLNNWKVPLVLVSICGDGARRGSQDCDNVGSTGVSISAATGEGSELMTVAPPVGCPCVVRATTPDNSTVRLAPIEVIGWPVLTPGERPGDPFATAPASQVRVSAQLVTDHPSIASWFGGAMNRSLRITIHNRGPRAVTNLVLTATAGRDEDGGQVLELPRVGTIAAGRERVVTVPLSFAGPIYGRYVVSGEVLGLDRPIGFETGTSPRPWGVVVLAVGVVVCLLVWSIRRRGRGRARGDRPAEMGALEPGDEPATPTLPARELSPNTC
jgi:hypothetical protein